MSLLGTETEFLERREKRRGERWAGLNLHIGRERMCRMSYEFLHFTHNSVCFLPRMHCTKMASSDKTTLKKKPRTLAEKGKNRFLGNDKKGGGCREG